MCITERSRLLSAHTHIERLLAGISADALAGRMDGVRQSWHELRAALFAHLAEEEATILPSFARADPADAAKIARDHHTIRRQLTEVDEALARGDVGKDQVLAVVSFFRMHHYHEDAGMYRWARERAATARA
jgi:hemerythrin